MSVRESEVRSPINLDDLLKGSQSPDHVEEDSKPAELFDEREATSSPAVVASASEAAPPTLSSSTSHPHDALSSPAVSEECWICSDSTSTSEDPILHGVCRCTGTIGAVHHSCIDQWVLTHQRFTCPSCNSTYNIVSTPPPPNVHYPTTLKDKLLIVLLRLLLPLGGRLTLLFIGAMVNLIMVPLLIGFAFYTPQLLLLSSTSALRHVVHHQRAWDWLNIIMYGWLNVAGMRGLRAGWRHWWHFFRPAAVTGGEDPASAAARLTPVDTAFWVVDRCCSYCGVCRSMRWTVPLDVSVGVALALMLRTREGTATLLGFAIFTAVVWRFTFPRKRIQNLRRRYEEVEERQGEATDLDIQLWYVTYVVEILLFTITLPILRGITFHYATSPLLVAAPSSWDSFVHAFSAVKVVLYWLMGMVCSLVQLRLEADVMVPLFAPGVDLFFMRSVDLQFDEEIVYWKIMVTQVFDADPLRMLSDFIPSCAIELTALYLFLALPAWSVMRLREWVWADFSELRLPAPLSAGFPIRAGQALDGNASVADWALLQQIAIWRESVVQPLAAQLAGGGVANWDVVRRSWWLVWLAYDLHEPQASPAAQATGGLAAELADGAYWTEWMRNATAGGQLCRGIVLEASQWLPEALDMAPSLAVDIQRNSIAAQTEELQRVRDQVARHFINGTIPSDLVSYTDAVGCHSASALLCMQQVPYLRTVGMWYATALLHHPHWFSVSASVTVVLGFLTIVACFFRFPIQRAQLRLLRPCVAWVGRHVVRMEGFLFDTERLEYVDEFLRNSDLEELMMPHVPIAAVFNRRENVVPPAAIPSCVRLRLLLFASVFFALSSIFVWTIPVLWMTGLLSLMQGSVPLVIATICGCFFCWNPRCFAESALIAVTVVFFLMGWTMLEVTLWLASFRFIPLGELARATFEYQYSIRRTVAPFVASEHDGGVWEDVSSSESGSETPEQFLVDLH